MVVAGLLLVPLLRMAGSAVISTRLKQTQSVLEAASEAVISYAALNNGCLPFAADDEGGLVDTDASGVVRATPDTGKGVFALHAGDLPWADLGLTNSFLDGDGLRIQYYLATPYADIDSAPGTTVCNAGFRGFPWDSTVAYDTPDDASIWMYDFIPSTTTRTLYELQKNKVLAAGVHPSTIAQAFSDQLPASLLEVRRGPDVTSATGGQNDVISPQNVFILIAPGKNRNTGIDRLFAHDITHTDAGIGQWNLGVNPVDHIVFSTEPNVDTGDSANNGDDTLLIMSFTQFKAEMSKYGLHMEPVCVSC